MTQPKIKGTGHGKPRTIYGSDGSNWYAIQVDSDGHVKIDVVSAALPTDAATQTTLALCLTALQLIDDLRAALGSVNTDDLQVDVKTSGLPTDAATQTTLALVKTAVEIIDDFSYASNKLFGYNDRWAEYLGGTQSGDGTYNDNSVAVPAGYIYIAQFAFIRNQTGARGRSAIYHFDGTNEYMCGTIALPARYEPLLWNGGVVLKAGDYVGVRQASCLNGDNIDAGVWGYKMKLS